jgi:MoxR-like ATPase
LTRHRTFEELGAPLPQSEFQAASDAIVANIERVIEGKTATVRLALAVLLAEGHLLIEDVPGVGKTKLAKALARSIDCSVRRIQFTPDLLPSDVTGVSVYNQESREFEFKPGAVFANIVVGDEINRASPKTQSALLECMEERQVTVDGVTYPLQVPFMVVATQNPIEMEGTYPLPEAQRDRFTARIAMGYPDINAELTMLDVHGARDALDDLLPISDSNIVRRMIATVRDVHVADPVKQYAVNIVTATRESPDLRLGASPRATLQLLRTARAVAAMEKRDFVLPDDLQILAVPVLAHRVIPTAEAQLSRRTTDAVVADIVHRLPLPTDRQPPRGQHPAGPYDNRQQQRPPQYGGR